MTASVSLPVQCSRAGCRKDAQHRIVWRNPRIHAEDREKIWVACDEHLAFLSGYLRDREFPVEIREGLA